MENTKCTYPDCPVVAPCQAQDQQDMPQDIKDYIVQLHNEKRAEIANGNDANLPSGTTASNMKEMSWSDEAASIAQCWTNQCGQDHDTCRNTASGEYVGQNYAGFGGYGNGINSQDDLRTKDRVKGMFDDWVSEEMDLDPQDISDFQDRTYVGHFTQVVWANTSQVGCGWITYDDPEGSVTWHNIHMFCNYVVGGNMNGASVFETGPTASDCDNGESQNYPGLCNAGDV